MCRHGGCSCPCERHACLMPRPYWLGVAGRELTSPIQPPQPPQPPPGEIRALEPKLVAYQEAGFPMQLIHGGEGGGEGAKGQGVGRARPGLPPAFCY